VGCRRLGLKGKTKVMSEAACRASQPVKAPGEDSRHAVRKSKARSRASRLHETGRRKAQKIR
jgi:hypothetical protein